MKKRFLSVSILMTCSLLAACSKTDGSTMPETIPETVEGAGQSLEGESQPSEGAGQSLEGGSQPLEGAGQSLDATASGVRRRNIRTERCIFGEWKGLRH